jgi:hypothetical protein
MSGTQSKSIVNVHLVEDNPGEPWSIKVRLKLPGRLKLDLEVLLAITYPLGTSPAGEFLKCPQPVPLRLRAVRHQNIWDEIEPELRENLPHWIWAHQLKALATQVPLVSYDLTRDISHAIGAFLLHRYNYPIVIFNITSRG